MSHRHRRRSANSYYQHRSANIQKRSRIYFRCDLGQGVGKSVDDLIDLLFGDYVRRGNNDRVTVETVCSAVSRQQQHISAAGRLNDAFADLKIPREGFFGLLISDELDTIEEPSSTNISNQRVFRQRAQAPGEMFAQISYPREQLMILDEIDDSP